MPARVVDASVLAAFAFNEPRAGEAAELIEGFNLYAPELLPYELCSVARAKSSQSRSHAAQISAAMEVALSIDMTLVKVPLTELLALALETGLTVYDAAYLYVSRTLKCPLLTFDVRLSRHA
jgi:predicted nucleic acid-binding protein